jgi:hypothetical protein
MMNMPNVQKSIWLLLVAMSGWLRVGLKIDMLLLLLKGRLLQELNAVHLRASESYFRCSTCILTPGYCDSQVQIRLLAVVSGRVIGSCVSFVLGMQLAATW